MFRILKKMLFAVLALVIILVTASIYVSIYVLKSKQNVEFEIQKGMSVNAIAQLLAGNDVIKTPKLFALYARIAGLEDKFKAGFYEMPAGMTLNDVIQKIVRGDVKRFEFKIIEGKNLNDIADAIRSNPMLGEQIASEFTLLSSDKDYINSIGIDSQTLEGYLFPDTYLISRVRSAREIVDLMVKKFKQVFDEEKKLGTSMAVSMTDHDVVTLSSIIEKETGSADERPLIASVFFNRLKIGMPLQSDPTIIYGLKNFDGNIRREDMSNPHPYNTYVHKGLPPGAICSPGRESIRAALNPAQSDYLYFVSKNDGTHIFSNDLAEHARAVMRYQLAR